MEGSCTSRIGFDSVLRSYGKVQDDTIVGNSEALPRGAVSGTRGEWVPSPRPRTLVAVRLLQADTARLCRVRPTDRYRHMTSV